MNYINKAPYQIGYEIRQLDCYLYDNEWVQNTSYVIGHYSTKAEDETRAFLNALHRRGIVCKRGKCRVTFDGDCYQLEDRKTGEPLFIAIPDVW